MINTLSTSQINGYDIAYYCHLHTVLRYGYANDRTIFVSVWREAKKHI